MRHLTSEHRAVYLSVSGVGLVGGRGSLAGHAQVAPAVAQGTSDWAGSGGETDCSEVGSQCPAQGLWWLLHLQGLTWVAAEKPATAGSQPLFIFLLAALLWCPLLP